MPMTVKHRPLAPRPTPHPLQGYVVTEIPQQDIVPTPIDWTTRSRRFVNPGEMERLVSLIGSVSPKVVIEFGCNNGRTAQTIMEYVPGIEKYVGVDVPMGYVTAKEVQRQEVPTVPGELALGDPRFELILREGGSQTLNAGDLPYCDAVFIDGDHSRAGVENDTMLALQKTRRGGVIIWHDFHGLGTVDVREVLLEKYRRGWKLVHVKDTWIVFLLV